jgi:gas vesicle protein
MTRWNEEESTGGGSFLLGALAGALVGAGVALLMAPKSGAETRQGLTEGYSSVRDAASRRYRDLAERANQRLGELEQKVEQYSDRASSTASAAVDAARTAANDAASGYPRV